MHIRHHGRGLAAQMAENNASTRSGSHAENSWFECTA
jgi:hypothetical protein